MRANCPEFSDISLHDSDDDEERLHVDIKEVNQQINESLHETEINAQHSSDQKASLESCQHCDKNVIESVDMSISFGA